MGLGVLRTALSGVTKFQISRVPFTYDRYNTSLFSPLRRFSPRYNHDLSLVLWALRDNDPKFDMDLYVGGGAKTAVATPGSSHMKLRSYGIIYAGRQCIDGKDLVHLYSGPVWIVTENSTHRRPPRFRKDAAAATNLARGHDNLRNDPQISAEDASFASKLSITSHSPTFTTPFISVPYLRRDVIIWLVYSNFPLRYLPQNHGNGF